MKAINSCDNGVEMYVGGMSLAYNIIKLKWRQNICFCIADNNDNDEDVNGWGVSVADYDNYGDACGRRRERFKYQQHKLSKSHHFSWEKRKT